MHDCETGLLKSQILREWSKWGLLVQGEVEVSAQRRYNTRGLDLYSPTSQTTVQVAEFSLEF